MAQELIQKVAVLGLIRDGNGRILMQKRGMTGKLPEAFGKWEFPGGEVEFGENPLNAVVREMREETGCEVTVGRPVMVGSRIWERTDGKRMHTLAVCYECWYMRGTPRPEEGRTTEVRWCTPVEIRQMGMDCLPDIPAFLAAAGLAS